MSALAQRTMGIGIVGCGSISMDYAVGLQKYPFLHLRACTDLDERRAKKLAEDYGIPGVYSFDAMLADPHIELIVNLTPPLAHVPVSTEVVKAGKHVYCEKPFAPTFKEAAALVKLAQSMGVRVGSAPDTFLGAGIQTCRSLIRDRHVIGTPVAATAFYASHGHETWHPRPEFFYQNGGGPLFDMGAYYITALVTLLGSVRRVGGVGHASLQERMIVNTPERHGERIPVETPTHITGFLEFEDNVVATMLMSFDVWDHHLPFVEIYGTTGSMVVPNPSTFEGPIQLRPCDGPEWQSVPLEFPRGLHRGIGVADMAFSIMQNEPHRSTAELALHVTEVMEALSASCSTGKVVDIQTTCPTIIPMPRSLPYRLKPVGLLGEDRQKVLAYFAGWTPQKKERTGVIDGIPTPLSRVILGTGGIASSSYRAQRASFAFLDSAFALGCHTFDTAAMYENESTLGAWMKTSGIRDEVVVITKGGFPFADGEHRLSREELTFDVERSLEHLKVDYIDLYFLHYDDPNAPIALIMETLNAYHQQGMIRAIGVSNWTTKRIAAANTYARAHHLAPVVASSVHLSLIPWAYPLWKGAVSLATDGTGDSELPWYVAHRLPLLAYSPLSRGFFADWFDPDSLEPRSMKIQQAFGSEKNVEKKRRVEALAKRKGYTRAQIALAYVLNQPLDVYTIVGVNDVRKLQENRDAVDIELTKEELEWLALARENDMYLD